MRIRGQQPTIKDVAELADVSWKTVTNVMHGRRNVSDKTRARVLEAAKTLGFRTSLAARQLRTGRTGIITLAVSELNISYFAQLAHRAFEQASERNLTIFVYETLNQAERERDAARGFDVAFSDGIILNPVALDAAGIAESKGQVPLVVVGEAASGENLDHVGIDNIGSAEEATDHLVGLGRRNIHFIGSSPEQTTGTGGLRLSGYRRSLRKAGLAVDDAKVHAIPTYSLDSGYRTVEAIFSDGQRPDALVCGNDEVAFGAMHALRARGLSVPHDVAVLGWDNAPMGEYFHPTLTTVKPDIDAVIHSSLDVLQQRIDGDESACQDHVVPHSLVIRESTGGNPSD